MRTLTSTLLAAQRSASTGAGTPYLRVLLRDRDVGVLHQRWQRWYTGGEVDGPCAAAVPADGALLRARIDPATGTLSHQRVASPGPSSTYSAWTGLGTVAVTPRLGLSAHTARALLASVRTDGVTVEVRDSAGSGATFGASAVVAVAGGTVTAVACALLDATGTAAVFFATAGAVYVATRTGLGAWSAPTAWTHSLSAVSGLSALGSTDYELLVSGTDATGTSVVWHTRYGAGGAAPPGTWVTPAVIVEASAGTSVTHLATGLAQNDVPRAAFVESYAGGGAYARVHLASAVALTGFADGTWRDPAAFGHASAYGLGMASAGADAWLVAPHGVWHTALVTAEADLTTDVLEADYEQSLDGGRLRLLLRNDHVRFPESMGQPALDPGNELLVEPGYVTAAGPEASSGPRFWITRVTRRRGPGASTVEVEAVDAWGVLRAWRAPRQLVWAAGTQTAAQIVADLARRTGVLALPPASTEAGALQPAFTVRAGEDGASALRRLLDTLPDELRPHLGTLTPFESQTSDATAYAYGTATNHHAVTALEVTAGRPRAGWARVFGAGVVAEAVDDAALARGAGTAIAIDDNLAVQARATARASTLLRRSALAAPRGVLTAPVNAGQELGDVIEVTDATLGLAAARFRVAALRLRYSRGGARPRYDLMLTLSEV